MKRCFWYSFPIYNSPTGKIVGASYLGKLELGESVFPETSASVDPIVSSLYYAADRRYNFLKEIEAEIDATNNEQEKALAEIAADEQVWQMKVDSEETQNALLQTNIDNYQKMVESNIAPSHTYGYKS